MSFSFCAYKDILTNKFRISKRSKSFSLDLNAARAMVLTLSYVASTAVFVSAVIILKGELRPELLQSVLSYIFISSLSAGIEPGTAKANLLRTDAQGKVFRFAYPWLFIAGVGKAILVAPLFMAAWYLSDTGGLGTFSVMMWSPVVVAVGFMTTDLRAAFDANGRYASAIWLKQGGLSAGLISLVLTIGCGLPIQAAIAISVLIRLAWLIIFVARGTPYLEKIPLKSETFLTEGLDRRWIDLALTSTLGALGGGLDRIIAFGCLGASEANVYYITYEILSKFWLIPYLFVPIVFASRVRNKRESSTVRLAVTGITGFGIVFVGSVTLITVFSPNLIGWVNSAALSNEGVILFAGAIVLTSFSMVLNADLQGIDKTRAVTTIALFSLLISAVAFYTLTTYASLYGLYVAWLLKSSLELAMTLIFICSLRVR